jgi:hypothetical protein
MYYVVVFCKWSGLVQIRAVHGPAQFTWSGPKLSKFEKTELVPPLAPGGWTPTGRDGPRSGPVRCFNELEKLIIYHIFLIIIFN